jgi:hypothetical protein
MMLLNPLQSYPYSQTNLLSIYFVFYGIANNDAFTNGTSQFQYTTNLSASSPITCSNVIVSAVSDSTLDIKNESGNVYNRGRCVNASITGFKDIWNNSTNLTMSIGNNSGLYGYDSGSYNPGIIGYVYQYLESGPTHISMSGLNNGTYDVYLYAVVDDTTLSQASTFTLYSGSVSSSKSTNPYSVGNGPDTLGNGGQPIWVQDQTYVKFSDHSTNDGKINISWAIKAGSSVGPLNAIQIVQKK